MHAVGVLIEVYSLIVLVAVVGSWMDSHHPVFEYARRLTEPVLEPIRRVLPPAGGLDFSPFLLLIALHFLARAFLR